MFRRSALRTILALATVAAAVVLLHGGWRS